MQFLSRLLVNFSYFLNASDTYQRKRRFFYNILENDEYRYKKYFDLFMMILIFSSVFILIYDVKSDISPEVDIFNAYIISCIFFVEYMLRLWIHSSISKEIIAQDEYSDLLGRKFDLLFVVRKVFRDKMEYVLSIKAIIDLLAIMPFFHELRLLRIFILFRVFKIFRYAKSFNTFASVLASKRFEFLTLGMFSAIVIFVASVLIYVMEANTPDSKIVTLFDAFYWSIVTISTVGYGDVTAVSTEGQFVSLIVILAGISVLAFTTSLFVSAFTEKLEDVKESKVIQDVSKNKESYIICGYENIAKEVAKKLVQSNFSVLVLDESFQKVEEAKKDGLEALNYNPGNVDSYKKLNINLASQVKAILCLKEDDVANVYTALTVRSIDKHVKIMSLLMNSSNRNKLIFSGVDEILDDKELVGLVAREYLGQPVAFEVIHALRAENSKIKIEEITVTQRIVNNFALVSELSNVNFRVVLLGIYKQEKKRFYFNPIDETMLEIGDVLLVIGNDIFIREFMKFLMSKSSIKALHGKK